MRYFIFVVLLAGFYGLLSGQLHNGFLMGVSALCLALIVVISARMSLIDEESYPGLGTFARMSLYVPYLFWQIMLSNWDVFKRVWHPALPVEPELIRAPFSTRTAFGTVTLANSITLTPGTVTIEVLEDEFLIHALTREAAEGAKDGSMEAQVRRLEGSN